VFRGIYDYPQYSPRLKRTLSSDIDQVALAIARKSGWNIQPTGMAALNALRLSTQIQGQYAYLSDGPMNWTAASFSTSTLYERF